jgi:hypothetical protein
MAIGTHLNIDDQAPVRVFVGPYSVEVHCASTEIEMYEDALAVFIRAGEAVLPRLRASAGRVWAMPYQFDAAIEGPGPGPAAGTWVICDADKPIAPLLLSDTVELRWGELTWTITSGALARLLDRARRAQEVLRVRLDWMDVDDSDQEIPDREVGHEHAKR